MNEFGNQMQFLTIPADGIRNLNISSKNYRIHIVTGKADSFVLRFCNNRFRMLEIMSQGDCLNLSEKMAVTFYEFFRIMELMKDNELLIELPQNCETISIQPAVFSSAGKISCSVLGKPEEYNVSCAADRRNVQNPCYPYYENAVKRIELHSGMSVPNLCFG